MKTKLNSTTATIEMSRDEFLNLWCQMTEIIRKDYMWRVQQALPLSYSKQTCKNVGELFEKLYETFGDK